MLGLAQEQSGRADTGLDQLDFIPAIPPAAQSLVRAADPTGAEPSSGLRCADRAWLAGATSRPSTRGARNRG
ncbi:hypothetical protein THSYN_06345 [Candidatus Thiodictyon syntrophicum]|uniref:Uncharacterized protein n=1 Tax=Candidatus Thiodictyon syntrophicum TaxID=1166950 RepID=A0A2K8U4X7_9GAMM|nr:hypothetical protein THSYN_06345 [Candidatus Thiodictyon syntrophicum]